MKVSEKVKKIIKVVGYAGGLGSSLLVGAACGPIIGAQANVLAKAIMTLGAMGLGGVAANATMDYFDETADGMAAMVDDISAYKTNQTDVQETEA